MRKTFWFTLTVFSILTLYQTSYSQTTNAMITFNFDDGYASVYTQALPSLKTYNFPGVVFPIASGIGQSWAVSWDQLWTMFYIYHWEVGNHTLDHTSLTGDSTGIIPTDTDIINEVRGARNLLETHGILPVTILAYPYDDYNDHVIDLLQNDGTLYGARIGGCTVGWCSNTPPFTKWTIVALSCDYFKTAAAIEPYIDQAINDNAWLVLEIHDVISSGTPSAYQILRTELDAIVNYVYSKKALLSVVTMSQGTSIMIQREVQ